MSPLCSAGRSTPGTAYRLGGRCSVNSIHSQQPQWPALLAHFRSDPAAWCTLEQEHFPTYRGCKELGLYPSLMPTKSNRKGTTLARFWSTPCGPSFPSSFCVLSLFSVSVPNFVLIFFCLVRGEEKLQLWRACGYSAGSTLETNSRLIWGLKTFQFGTWSHWLKWKVHFFLCYCHSILSCPSGLIFVLTRREVSMVQRRDVLPALITKPAGLLLNQEKFFFWGRDNPEWAPATWPDWGRASVLLIFNWAVGKREY